jgi:hypothetical protein
VIGVEGAREVVSLSLLYWCRYSTERRGKKEMFTMKENWGMERRQVRCHYIRVHGTVRETAICFVVG